MHIDNYNTTTMSTQTKKNGAEPKFPLKVTAVDKKSSKFTQAYSESTAARSVDVILIDNTGTGFKFDHANLQHGETTISDPAYYRMESNGFMTGILFVYFVFFYAYYLLLTLVCRL
jgi:hypothetical protein